MGTPGPLPQSPSVWLRLGSDERIHGLPNGAERAAELESCAEQTRAG
ncbi:hypothetical protein [Streptomyces roseolus]